MAVEGKKQAATGEDGDGVALSGGGTACHGLGKDSNGTAQGAQLTASAKTAATVSIVVPIHGTTGGRT